MDVKRQARRLRNRYRRKAIEAWRNRVANPVLGREAIYFLHIRKTGGSALWPVLVNRASRHYDLRMRRHSVTMADVPGRVFFFIRDPLTRLESGFYDRLRQGRPKYDTPWTDEEAEAFARFRTLNYLAESLADGDDRAASALRVMQHVNSSYWEWFESCDYLLANRRRLFFIGHQENLEADFRRLCSKLEIAASLPTDPVVAHRNPTPKEPLSPRAEAALREWLRGEYEAYGLLCELASELP